MTLAGLLLGAFLGFLAGVLAMSLLRVAAFDPPTLEPASNPEVQRPGAIFATHENRGISKQ
jgi:hypothetical protein